MECTYVHFYSHPTCYLSPPSNSVLELPLAGSSVNELKVWGLVAFSGCSFPVLGLRLLSWQGQEFSNPTWFVYSKWRLLTQHIWEFLHVWPGPFPDSSDGACVWCYTFWTSGFLLHKVIIEGQEYLHGWHVLLYSNSLKGPGRQC